MMKIIWQKPSCLRCSDGIGMRPDFPSGQLADRVGITKSYVSSLELGYRAPNLNLLIKIARSLEVRPGELLDALVDEAEKN